MNSQDRKNDLIMVLKNAGWNEKRTIKNKIENSTLYEIIPAKVLDFLCEFGELTIHAENRLETMSVHSSNFDYKKAFDFYSLNTYKIGDEIDLSEDKDQDYYYSALIGLHLYPVAQLIEQNTVMMDELGNFYVITFIPELVWISNETFDALDKIIFGSSDVAIFNEHTMKWMAPIGKELSFFPPVNKKLTKNPWNF